MGAVIKKWVSVFLVFAMVSPSMVFGSTEDLVGKRVQFVLRGGREVAGTVKEQNAGSFTLVTERGEEVVKREDIRRGVFSDSKVNSSGTPNSELSKMPPTNDLLGRRVRVTTVAGVDHEGVVKEWGPKKVALETSKGSLVFETSEIKRAIQLDKIQAKNKEEDSEPVDPEEKNRQKIKWKQDLDSARQGQVVLWTLGFAGTVVGFSTYISGNSDIEKAKETPGCSYDGGGTILCSDSRSQSAAQSSLDSGKSKMMTGGLISAAGCGFLIWGWMQGERVRTIKKEGVKNGFSLNYTGGADEKVSLVYSYSFGG